MHRAGGKITGSHTTVTQESARVVDVGQKLPLVKKIVLGVIKRGSSKRRRLKSKEVRAGWHLVVYGPSYFQELYFYCDQDDRDIVKAELETALMA